MKRIVVQVSNNNCESCRFNIPADNEDSTTRYCLAYLKPVFRDNNLLCKPVSDCIDIGERFTDEK